MNTLTPRDVAEGILWLSLGLAGMLTVASCIIAGLVTFFRGY